MKLPDLKWWHTLLIILILLGTGAVAIYGHFAKAADIVKISDRIDKNADANFRLRQQIINNTRTDREERKLKPNPRWLKDQQNQLNLDRCLHAQRHNPKLRCNK